MSCIFALALPNVGIVCADTRLNPYYGNLRVPNDGGDISFDCPDGRTYHLQDRNRKMQCVRSGCMAGAGCFPLIRDCFEELVRRNVASLRDAEEVFREVYEQRVPEIHEWWRGAQLIEETLILTVYPDRANFSVATFRFDNQTSPVGNYYLMSPPDFCGNRPDLISKIERVGGTGVEDFIRILGEVFHEVHLQSQTVSDRLDLALLTMTEERTLIIERLTEDNQTIVSASASEVRQLLATV